ncbi:pantoate--beta-alanine ligase [Candidatus Nitrospira bockiana]
MAGLSTWRRALWREGVTVGFVPTMGGLHEGHRALIRAARLSSDALVVSIFVNPMQFAPEEDLARYPRPFRRDAALCRETGADLVFAPSPEAMYPPGFQTSVLVRKLAARWEGAVRPAHFEGVATVVTKLLNLVQPHAAWFGQKDYQQALLVRRLVSDLNLGTTIRLCPTVREADGLALSSRNAYLSEGERRVAPVLFRALRAGRSAILAGERDAAGVERVMRRTLRAEPSVKEDYLAVCDPESLEPLARVGRVAVLLGAVRVGSVRLIDNLVVRRRA